MQQRSEETRTHILEAANRLFSRTGYEATSVAEICQEAGVSKGALYHHFSTKQAVFLALLDSWLSGLDEGFSAARQQTQDVPGAILQMADLVGNVYQMAEVKPTILLEFWLHALRDPVIWQAARAPYNRYLAYFASMIREGVGQGSLQPVDEKLAARVLTSLALGLLMQSLFGAQDINWQQEARQSIQLFMDGLLPRREEI
jgi:AcrR family transcriptional regulator